MIRFLSLFAGIGGFDLGLERAGWQCVGQVEIDPFCRRVLEKHWPNVPRFEDVRDVTAELIRERCGDVDAVVGGFPCQDISIANPYGVGIDGERSGLWGEQYRIICELRARIAVMENVPALLNKGLGRVLGDLAAGGYDAEWQIISAAFVGGIQRRDRLFIVAYPNGIGMEGMFSEEVLRQSALSSRQTFESVSIIRERFDTFESRLCRTLHGIPSGVDRMRALGNAIYPTCAEVIGRAILNKSFHR